MRAQLSENEVIRYGRQLILPNWGSEEQLKLNSLHVGISINLPSAALYLAAAGVGRISLLDYTSADDDISSRAATNSRSTKKLLAHLTHFNRDGDFELSADGAQGRFDYLLLLENEIQILTNIHESTASIVVQRTVAGCKISINSSSEPAEHVTLPHCGSDLPFHLPAGTAAAALLIRHQLELKACSIGG